MRRGMLAAGTLFLFGCGLTGIGRPKEHRVQTQEQAGSVHVAVLSVAPWEEYVEDLQPQFQLTADGALERVLRQGRVSARDVVDRGSVAIAVGEGAKAEPKEPGAIESRAPATSGTLQNDAMTQYWAAAALYQEVQLLNRYLRDAATRRDTKNYVVRMQISLMPRARHEPYDAYSTISFFAGWQGQVPEALQRIRGGGGTGSAPPADSTPGRGVGVGMTHGGGDGASGKGTKAEARKESEPPTRASSGTAPLVLPILVTDNLEASLASSSRERSRQASASLGFGGGGSAASLAASRLRAELESATGLDLNSLLTVARVSDNTIRVRLGAMQQGTTNYAMIPRTHNVTVLVMLPGEPRYLSLVARTTMVDAESGEELPYRSDARLGQLRAEVAKKYRVSPALIRKLLPLVQANDSRGFFGLAPKRFATSLWVDVVTIMVGGQYASTVVDLNAPRRRAAFRLPPEQRFEVVDDGVRSRVRLAGGAGFDVNRIRAWLVVQEVPHPAERIEVARGGDTLLLEFGSLAKLPAQARKAMYLQFEHTPEHRAKYRNLVYRPVSR